MSESAILRRFTTGEGLAVAVVRDAEAIAELVLEQVEATLGSQPAALLCFATGRTFTPFLRRLAEAVARRRVSLEHARATHLDEYAGLEPLAPGSMSEELTAKCPPLLALWHAGRFLAVPGHGDAAALAAHQRRLAELGGVHLCLAGIGRNGHIAFNEPGTPLHQRLHRTRLAESTRVANQGRFAGRSVPAEAVTLGPQDILDARRAVMVATGADKADAVRAMLEDPIGPACPASVLRRHRNALLLLDVAAAARLTPRGEGQPAPDSRAGPL